MNKAKKRLISVLLIALMVCTLLPTSAFAALETGETRSCTFKILYISDEFYTGYNYGDSWTVSYTCQDKTGHSGYNHSMACSVIKDQVDKAKGMVSSDWDIKGWSKTDGKNPQIFTTYTGTTTTHTEPYTLYIVAKKNAVTTNYSLNYDGNGADSNVPATQTGSNTTGSYTFTVSTQQPIREGYEFLGWSSVLGGNVDIGAQVTLTTAAPSKTIYAVWKEILAPTYTVTYTDGVDDEEVFADQVTSGLALDADTPAFDGTPTREGYEFKGWNPEVAAKVSGDAVYTATWEEIPAATYTVTYTDGVADEEVFADQVTYGLELNADTPAFNGTPTREGYTFKGWTPTVAEKVTGNATYTATWEALPADTFTVTYTDGVEDEVVFDDQVYTGLINSDETPAFVGTPTREGYEFMGWNPAVANMVTGNALYTATWQKSGSEKEGEPGMEKKVNGQESTSAAAGETVTYTLKSNVPSYLKEYFAVPDPIVEEAKKALKGAADNKKVGEYVLVLHDALQTGVSFNNDIQVTVNGVVLDSSLYSVATAAEDSCTFEVTMDLVKIYAVGGYFTEEEIADCPEIVVTYTGTVSADATAGIYKNIAWAAYEGKESAKPEVNVYVYGIKVFKYDLNNSNAPLANAKFILTDTEGKEVATGTSGEDGYIVFDGLKEGEYKLQETAAPDGYACSNKIVVVNLPGDASADYYANVRFANQLVPHTGGNGTMMYTVGGSVLILAAALLFIVSRKTKRNTKA